MCICYAGPVKRSIDIIRDLNNKLADFLTIESIVSYLLTYQTFLLQKYESQNVPDFVLVSTDNSSPIMYEIKNGNAIVTVSAWLGDEVAYRQFNAKCNTNISFLSDPYMAMSAALNDVISNDEFSSVGGYCIGLKSVDNRLEYDAPIFDMHVGFKVKFDEWVTVPIGGRFHSTYRQVFLFPNSISGEAALGVYYPDRKVALFTLPLAEDQSAQLLRLCKVSKIDEFINYISNNCNVELINRAGLNF